MIAMSNFEEFARAVGKDVKSIKEQQLTKSEFNSKDCITGNSEYDFLKRSVQELMRQNKSLQEQLALIKPAPRRAPTGYYIQVVNGVKTVWFDNDSGLKNLTGDSQIGWGRSQDFNNNVSGSFDLPQSIIKTSMGIVTVDSWKKAGATYWDNDITVLNPVKNKDDYNWSNARFVDKSIRSGWIWEREANVIRIMYELGIWDAKTVESLGAVRR